MHFSIKQPTEYKKAPNHGYYGKKMFSKGEKSQIPMTSMMEKENFCNSEFVVEGYNRKKQMRINRNTVNITVNEQTNLDTTELDSLLFGHEEKSTLMISEDEDDDLLLSEEGESDVQTCSLIKPYGLCTYLTQINGREYEIYSTGSKKNEEGGILWKRLKNQFKAKGTLIDFYLAIADSSSQKSLVGNTRMFLFKRGIIFNTPQLNRLINILKGGLTPTSLGRKVQQAFLCIGEESTHSIQVCCQKIRELEEEWLDIWAVIYHLRECQWEVKQFRQWANKWVLE